MTAAVGSAKINLSLQVASPTPAGLHPIASLVTSVDWSDTLTAATAVADQLVVQGPAAPGVPTDETNLIWQAVAAHRARSNYDRPLSLHLDKTIPAAAGLAGGSGNAAAALRIMDSLSGADLAEELAPQLGSDVPFAVAGGRAMLSGYGERFEREPPHTDFALAIVVPPIELSTPAVYKAWDDLGEPSGPQIVGRWLPPSLRQRAPLANDLFPAAISVAPELGDWQRDVADAWDRPVLMSGSGSALFSFFATLRAAVDAVAGFSDRCRAVKATLPTRVGARIIEG